MCLKPSVMRHRSARSMWVYRSFLLQARSRRRRPNNGLDNRTISGHSRDLCWSPTATACGRPSAGDAALGRHRLRPWPPARPAAQGRLGIGLSACLAARLRALRRLKREQDPASALYLHVGAPVRRSRPRGFVRCSRGLGLPPISVSQCIRTC